MPMNPSSPGDVHEKSAEVFKILVEVKLEIAEGGFVSGAGKVINVLFTRFEYFS